MINSDENEAAFLDMNMLPNSLLIDIGFDPKINTNPTNNPNNFFFGDKARTQSELAPTISIELPKYRQKHLAMRLPRIAGRRAKESAILFLALFPTADQIEKDEVRSCLNLTCEWFLQGLSNRDRFRAPACRSRLPVRGGR